MEQEMEKEVASKKIVILNETEWRAHIVAAKEYSGTNRNYCASQGLNLRQFKKYKGKFGFAMPRGRPKKLFVRVETKAAPAPKEILEKPQRPREFRGLPDPHWMAEFVTSLLGMR